MLNIQRLLPVGSLIVHLKAQQATARSKSARFLLNCACFPALCTDLHAQEHNDTVGTPCISTLKESALSCLACLL